MSFVKTAGAAVLAAVLAPGAIGPARAETSDRVTSGANAATICPTPPGDAVAAVALSASAAPAGVPPGAAAGPATVRGLAFINSAWWDEDDVTLSTTAPITALTLTITVPAADVRPGGQYQTVSTGITRSVSNGPTLSYGFALTDGQTLPPGDYRFAALLRGNGATHDDSGDRWSITYTAGGVTYRASGGLTDRRRGRRAPLRAARSRAIPRARPR